jgi:hypothetical protein
VKEPESGVEIGKFCSRDSSSDSDDGGTDRFLLPGEQSIFEACVNNPPYYEPGSEYTLAAVAEAVKRHLPRKPGSANDPAKIREEATLVLIVATDEAPQELKYGGSYKGQSGFLSDSDIDIQSCSTSQAGMVHSYIQDWLNLLQGTDATYGLGGKAIVHLIAGVCKSDCGGWGSPIEFPWGLQEICQTTGGQSADICQKNLGTTLQLMIDSIVGASSPVVLDLVPISASLAVALEKEQLVRSRIRGFDYNSASNSILFIGVDFKPGDKVVVSYRRWVKQAPLDG